MHGATPGSTAALLLSLAPATDAFNDACVLLVDSSQLLDTRPSAVGGSGFTSFSLPQPALRSLIGTNVYGQGALLAANGQLLSLTNAIDLLVGE